MRVRSRFRSIHRESWHVSDLLFLGFLIVSCLLVGCERQESKTADKGKASHLKEDKRTKVSLILAVGGLGDNSVNDSAYAGLQLAKEKFGVDIQYVEPRESAEFPDLLHNLAKSGAGLVIGIGFSMQQPMENVAKEYPKTVFSIIDVPAKGDNVVSLVFREHEGAFLAGALAAKMARSKMVGFIGGMDIPLLRKWQKGFEHGVSHVDPTMKVDSRYIDVTVKGFGDPVRGKELALAMYAAGCDVLLQVTGGSAAGVYRAVKETGKFAIGSDQNQDSSVPGLVLTSVVRDVERLVVTTVERLLAGDLRGGVLSVGLKEKGIHLTDFEYTREIIGESNLNMLERLKNEIIEGKIRVPDYTQQNSD